MSTKKPSKQLLADGLQRQYPYFRIVAKALPKAPKSGPSNQTLPKVRNHIDFSTVTMILQKSSRNDVLTHIGKSRKLFSKNGRWLRGYPGNLFQTFSRFCNFGAWLRGFSGNYFQVNFMSTYPWKNIFPKNGSWLRGFSGNFFQYLVHCENQINTVLWWRSRAIFRFLFILL